MLIDPHNEQLATILEKLYPPNANLTGRQTRTIDEAAEIIGVSRSTMYRLVHEGEVESIKVGRRMLVPVKVIERLLDPGE